MVWFKILVNKPEMSLKTLLPACITFDLVEGLDTLCRHVDEDPPMSHWFTRSLHLALLLLLLTAVLLDLSFDIYTPKEVDG